MSEEIKVTKILIKIRKEEVISLTVAEIRELQKEIDDLLGKLKDDPRFYPDTIFVPHCPPCFRCPSCQPWWEVTWGTSIADSLD